MTFRPRETGNAAREPFAGLPRASARGCRLLAELKCASRRAPIAELLARSLDSHGELLELSEPEITSRAAGIGRNGVVVVLAWPRLNARLALGLETSLVHAIIDRMLGFVRIAGEERLQVTPVEWGVMSYLVARVLAALQEEVGALGAWDLLIDRVGHEHFGNEEREPLVTIRWAARVGATAGSVRLWVPTFLVDRWLDAKRRIRGDLLEPRLMLSREAIASLHSEWTAEAGLVSLPMRGGPPRAGTLLHFSQGVWRGSPRDPLGILSLIASTSDGLYVLRAEPAPLSSAKRVHVYPPIRFEHHYREPRNMSALSEDSGDEAAPPGSHRTRTPGADLPVSLTVELGRVSIPLSRLADLKPGDLVELNRHAREPVELTSNGRLVARGELIQLDAELGIRVTNVFL